MIKVSVFWLSEKNVVALKACIVSVVETSESWSIYDNLICLLDSSGNSWLVISLIVFDGFHKHGLHTVDYTHTGTGCL